jgi:hypothetical protein
MDIKIKMELTIEYGFLIASCCYLWIMVALYFSFFMNNSDSLSYNEDYWFVTISSITLAFLVQAINWLVKALPLELSQGSMLAFQQGITFIMTIFILSLAINIYDKSYGDAMRDFSSLNLCCLLVMGLVQNILSYYLIETDNSGVRISCYVFSVIVWIAMIPAFFYNWLALFNIFKSDATCGQRILYSTFFVFSKLLVTGRQILFLAYYPSLIFVSRDKERFETEFTYAQEYLIPSLDICTLILSLIHLVVMYNSEDTYTEFFNVT